MAAYDAVVLAGGAGRRLGGVDKPALVVGGATLLERALGACVAARHRVVVGPRRPTTRQASWTREEPPGGGPLAALAAGVAALPRSEVDAVVVLAADLPYVDASTVERLVAALDGEDVDAACLVDETGRRQPLAAAYRTEPLHRALDAAAPHADRPLRSALGDLRTRLVPAHGRVAWDIDTPADLAAVRAEQTPGAPRCQEAAMQEYVRRLAEVLGLDPESVDVGRVLDLARDAAHHVERPAAPVTTYLVGLAAGLAGGAAADVDRAATTATDLVTSWPPGGPDPRPG